MRSRTGPPTSRGRSMMLHARACPHPDPGDGRPDLAGTAAVSAGRPPAQGAQLPATVTAPVPVEASILRPDPAACGTVTRTEPTCVFAVTRYATVTGTRTVTSPTSELATSSWGGAVHLTLIMPGPMYSRIDRPDMPLAWICPTSVWT